MSFEMAVQDIRYDIMRDKETVDKHSKSSKSIKNDVSIVSSSDNR